jgi:uncharacterized protein (UPF0332 family)
MMQYSITKIFNLGKQIVEKAYLSKSLDSLAAANDLYQKGCYDDCASRAYYACFQIAIIALQFYGIIDADVRSHNHKSVISKFVKCLINEKGIYSTAIRPYLKELQDLRHTADYELEESISRDQAKELIRKANEFHRLVVESLQMDVIK